MNPPPTTEAAPERERSEPKCAALRKDGQPCTAPLMGDTAYCFAHHPDRAAERDEARRRGGVNSSTAARLQGLVPPALMDVYSTLAAVLDELHTGALDPKVATAMAGVARAMVAVLSAGQFEERIAALERATGASA